MTAVLLPLPHTISGTVPPAAARSPSPSLSLDELVFRYEPFPIGRCTNFLDAAWYDSLLAHWPANDLFLYKPALGNKFSLSEVNHADRYEEFVRRSAEWSVFHRFIKAPAFIAYVLDTLREHQIDMGYAPERLRARFEFSMLAGDGGNIKPHTDAPNKLVTLVVNMVRPGEWNDEYGGGTAVLKPKDIRKNYNHLNQQLEFDEVECLETFAFAPNACVVFVKTFNSLHAVYPIRGRADLPRRSLTINIEDPNDPRLPYLKKQR